MSAIPIKIVSSTVRGVTPIYVDDTSQTQVVIVGNQPDAAAACWVSRAMPGAVGVRVVGAGVTGGIVSGGLSGGGGGSVPISYLLTSPTQAALTDTASADLSADGMTWQAQRGAYIRDSFGKRIQYIQRYNGGAKRCLFIVSNDNGVTWSDLEPVAGGEGFLVRGSCVYDAARDCIHYVCITENPGDGGMIYRRITLTRDGSNNITGITRTASVSLDDPSGGVEFPTIKMSDSNTLLIAYTARWTTGGEIRACKCDISSNANAGNTATNWVNIGFSSAAGGGGTPSVGSLSSIYKQTSNFAWPYFTMAILSSGDIGWGFWNATATNQWKYKTSIKNAANSWSTLSSEIVVSDMIVSGADGGYAEKRQLITDLLEISGTVYFAAPVWLSNAAGDTVLLFKITSGGTVTNLTIYSAGGAHSYAPTVGAGFDSVSGLIPVTYIKTSTSDVYAVTVDPSTMAISQSELLFSTVDCDIPLIVDVRDPNNKMFVAYRKQGAPPQGGYYGTFTWSN